MQNFSYMHKSDGDIKNDRINEEKTQEKSVSIPRLDTNPDAKSITVSDNANRWQNSNTSPSPKTLSAGTNQANTENTDRTDHRTGMPSDGTLPRTGTPMNGSTPPTGMPQNNISPETPNMPQSYLPYGSLNYVPLPKVTPYNTPMGIPLYPLYGYDNCEDLDRDLNYLKQLYPNTAKRIQKEIDEECDKLEYDGSVMFDEYPDKVTLEKIIDRVYEKVKDLEEAPQVEINSYFYPPRNRQNLLRDLVTIILLNEIFNRRRRYRSRRRWF